LTTTRIEYANPIMQVLHAGAVVVESSSAPPTPLTLDYERHDLSAPGRLDKREQILLDAKAMEQPRRWARPRRIFVCSMTDLFGEWVTDEQIDQVFAAMIAAPRHTFMLLTKRPSRMVSWWTRPRRILGGGTLAVWPAHIWAGTTIESDAFTWRANVLRRTPAPVRFVSAEPLLSGLPGLCLDGISWLIIGGESGPGRRELDHTWARDLVERGHGAGLAVFVKQDSGPRPGLRPDFLGALVQEWPTPAPAHSTPNSGARAMA
jgi:protein gp37